VPAKSVRQLNQAGQTGKASHPGTKGVPSTGTAGVPPAPSAERSEAECSARSLTTPEHYERNPDLPAFRQTTLHQAEEELSFTCLSGREELVFLNGQLL